MATQKSGLPSLVARLLFSEMAKAASLSAFESKNLGGWVVVVAGVAVAVGAVYELTRDDEIYSGESNEKN